MPEELSETHLRRRNFWRMFLVFLLIALAVAGMRGVVYFAVASALYFALKRVAGDWSQAATATPNAPFLIASVVVALTLPLCVGKFGVKRPGSFFERSEYEAKLYVYMYPLYSEAHKVPAHRVPATISASIKGETDQDEHYQSWREYWLLSAFMPHDGRITFDDCRVELQKTVTCLDSDDRGWQVVLTPIPAN